MPDTAPAVVHVTGLPGSGKTTLGHALAEQLGIPFRSIDDERIKLLLPGRSWPLKDHAAWHRLRGFIESVPASIVETVGTSRRLETLLAGCAVLTIVVIVDEDTRQQRLVERSRSGHPLVGNPERYLAAITRVCAVPAGDLEWDGMAGGGSIVPRVQEWPSLIPRRR